MYLLRTIITKVKLWSQNWLIAAGTYPGLCSMKRLEVFLLPLDGMLVHHRSLPRNSLGFSPTICWYPFIHLSGERHCESKVSCPRTQHNVPGQGSIIKVVFKPMKCDPDTPADSNRKKIKEHIYIFAECYSVPLIVSSSKIL